MGASTDYPKFESCFSIQITSHATIIAPMYSAYVLDNCWLFLTTPTNNTTSKKNMKPLVDLLLERLQAQSTSVYPCTCNWLLAS